MLFHVIFILIACFFSPSYAKLTCVAPSPHPPPLISTDPQVADYIFPYLKVYHNGTITRGILPQPTTTPTPKPNPDPDTGVLYKDITQLDSITNISARMFVLPFMLTCHERFPIVVHFHGGAFIHGSAFNQGAQRDYLNHVVLQGGVIVVSFNYRLFPEFALPMAYEDSWSALQWVSRQRSSPIKNSWISSHGDFSRLFLTGDSAGANIVHNMMMRAANEVLPNGVSIRGVFLASPYFLGSNQLPNEPCDLPLTPEYRVWKYVCPRSSCPNGVDDPVINPEAPGAPNLSRLATAKLMIYTSDLDYLVGRSLSYKNGVEKSGWPGKMQVYVAIGAGHGFHVSEEFGHRTARVDALTKILITRFVRFIHT